MSIHEWGNCVQCYSSGHTLVALAVNNIFNWMKYVCGILFYLFIFFFLWGEKENKIPRLLFGQLEEGRRKMYNSRKFTVNCWSSYCWTKCACPFFCIIPPYENFFRVRKIVWDSSDIWFGVPYLKFFSIK